MSDLPSESGLPSVSSETVTPHGVAVGGGVVARLGDGRVCFVDGALVGERVRVAITNDSGRHVRARVVEVIEPSPHRVTPPCRHVERGCGGCDLQIATLDEQVRMKVAAIGDAWQRIGRLARPDVMVRSLPSDAYRTTIRVGVTTTGGSAFRAAASNDLIDIDSCMVAHPLVDEIVRSASFGGDEAMIRVGARTGERMVVVSPNASGSSVPDGVQLVGADESGDSWIHEEVSGRRWRISARSFFQTRPDGAEALVDAVRDAVGRFGASPRRLVDLGAGVGLFAGTVSADHVVAVERSRSSVADARVNLSDVGAEVIGSSIESWRPTRADVVVADPSRQGLGRVGVDRIVATGAPLVVLVSCDAGSGGRDAGLLVEAGYRCETVALVDLFPHTHHVEVVSTFVR